MYDGTDIYFNVKMLGNAPLNAKHHYYSHCFVINGPWLYSAGVLYIFNMNYKKEHRKAPSLKCVFVLKLTDVMYWHDILERSWTSLAVEVSDVSFMEGPLSPARIVPDI